MSTKRNVLVKSVRMALWSVGFAAINLIPGTANATAIVGATFPQQVIQEATSLQNYAKDVTTSLASVQNEINTLNSYETDLQNLATLPAGEVSKITTPIQQMEYNYQEVMGLKNEYEDLYGNLANIKQTVEQQNLDILNSSLTPEDYLNTVETAQTHTEAQTRAQIHETANSMRAVDKLAPEIEAQSHEASTISGNTSGQVEMAKELNLIEQQNQILLQDISSAQLARSHRRETHEEETIALNKANKNIPNTDEVAAKSIHKEGSIFLKNAAASGSKIDTWESCLNEGHSFISCDKKGQ